MVDLNTFGWTGDIIRRCTFKNIIICYCFLHRQPYGFCLPRWAAVGGTTDVLSAALYRIRPWMTKFMRHDEWRAPSLNETQRNYARGKTRLIACFVSKCVSPSRREEYVAQLKRHVAVDIYGKCGNLSCGSGPRPGVATLQHPECETVLNRTYKFYLAFENTYVV